jgi:uncharacterized membrane protein YeiH
MAPVSYDELWTATGIAFRYFDLIATFSWAISGAVLAARRGYDLTGTFAIALVSSCGGGLLRDAVFLQAGPPALVRTPSYVLLPLLAAGVVWLAGRRMKRGIPPMLSRGMRLADAIGLGAFAVVGMRLALAASVGVLGAVLIGVSNAVGGGLLRSVLLRRTPEVFRPGEFTALAALAGALLYAALAIAMNVDERIAGGISILLSAATNWASVRFRLRTTATWTFPSRPPRFEIRSHSRTKPPR